MTDEALQRQQATELAARADVAEHIQLMLVFSTHAFFLSVPVVETRESSGTARSFQIMKSPICARQSSTGLSAMVYPFDPLTKASPLLRAGGGLLLPDLL